MPETLWERVHRDLTRMHRVLGTNAAIVRALRRDPLPVRRVVDIGCGRGGLLDEIRRKVGAEPLGVELRTPNGSAALVPIIRADAVRDPLPACDVAICLCLAHHLEEDDVVRLIRNVGRSARRFILVDLVRHALPLALFRLFVAPFLSRVNAFDGAVSVRRSYTPAELRGVVGRALKGSRAHVRHTVAPLYARQMVDITYSATHTDLTLVY